MSVANELQRIVNAKTLIGQKAVNMGLVYDDDNGLHPLTLDENGNPEQTIDTIAGAIDTFVSVSTSSEIAERSSLEVNETGKITARVIMGVGECVAPAPLFDPNLPSVSDPILLEHQLPVREGRTITHSYSEQVAIEKGELATGDIKVAALPLNYKDISETTASQATVLEGVMFWDNEHDFVEGKIPRKGAATASIDPTTQTKVTLDGGYYTSVTVSITDDLENALAAI